jgi:hypothetical protein
MTRPDLRERSLPVGPLAAALLVVALTLLFFWKIVFTNLILVGIDSFLYFYPYKAAVAEALRAGRFPLWNPYLFMGAPLFANMQTAVLYPLNWLFLWLPAPQQVAASIVLHVALAGVGTLAYTRRSLKLGWSGALAAAVVFGLGGLVGAQVEHVNQVNVLAWLPWAFLLLDAALAGGRRAAAVLGLAGVIALMLLAGHAQTVYICLAALGLYAIANGKYQISNAKWQIPNVKRQTSNVKSPTSNFQPLTSNLQLPTSNLQSLTFSLQSLISALIPLAAAVAAAALLAAVQLLPTLELSRLSFRSGGLPYSEVTSFSLRPWLIHYTLLPPFGTDLSQVFGEAYGEYVAYVGIIGLGLAAIGAWRRWRRPIARFFILLAGLGLFLALGRLNPVYYVLYKVVPGFAMFRVPARWLLFYAFGMSLLAGIGMEEIPNLKSQITNQRSAGGSQPSNVSRQPQSVKSLISNLQSLTSNLQSPISNFLSPLLLALLCLELFVASRGLRYNQPTAPEAFTFLRPSIAHLETDPGLGRFLSLSGIVYDPGDLAEMRAIFAGQLPDQAIYDYVVAAKEKEVLFYNLPLLYKLYSVDGYDGGLLPLREFVTMERLFLDEAHLAVDGRLREALRDVPPGRLLSLLGVKYVITDKVYDVWIDGVFYDLQFSARLAPATPGQDSPGSAPRIEAADLPDFPTTALGIVSHLEGGSDLPDGTPVARVTIADSAGQAQTFDLLAGRDTSEGRYSPAVAHRQARVGHAWRDDASGSDYIALIPLGDPRRLTALSVEGIAPAGEFVLRGLSLVDTRTTTSRQLTLSTDGHYRLVHSGDVKIYENLDVLPRAFVVHQAEVSAGDEQTIARMRDPAFDPSQTAVLASGQPLAGEVVADGAGSSPAQITRYTPEEVVVEATTDAPGYLLLTDAFYPGWRASVDGQPVEILRADEMFRAVRLEPGRHQVEFRYQPDSVTWGAWISAAALALWLAGMIWNWRVKERL